MGHFNTTVQWESEYAWCPTTITRGNMCLLKRLIKQLDISFHPVLSWLYRLLLLPPANFLLKLGKQNRKCRWALSCKTVFSIAASCKENEEVPSQLSDVTKDANSKLNFNSLLFFMGYSISFVLWCSTTKADYNSSLQYSSKWYIWILLIKRFPKVTEKYCLLFCYMFLLHYTTSCLLLVLFALLFSVSCYSHQCRTDSSVQL